MKSADKPLTHSNNNRRRPAEHAALDRLLHELDVRPPGKPSYELVSRWAAKHVWQVYIDGKPWVIIRYLLGPASQFPDRWRHLRLGELLYDARVGPSILGMAPESEALDGRAAIVEAALEHVTREELEARAVEAIALLGRLHSYVPLHEALSIELGEQDIAGISPVADLLAETKERWFEAVVGRWLEAGLSQITEATEVVGALLAQLDVMRCQTERIGIIVPAHNDPNAGNFMLNRQGALRMIDFEHLALSNPVADLGIFLTWYVDKNMHRRLLQNYPLADPDAVLDRMRVWVPLRYIGIAAHWAARLTHAKDKPAWDFAVESVDEWLRSACELVFDGVVPAHLSAKLDRVKDSLLEGEPGIHSRGRQHLKS